MKRLAPLFTLLLAGCAEFPDTSRGGAKTEIYVVGALFLLLGIFLVVAHGKGK